MSTGADLRHEADAARRIVLEAALASGGCHIGIESKVETSPDE